MKELVRRYHEALVKHIDALELAKADLMAGMPGAADTIRHIVHQLKGSGGTYGYQEITAAAEALQDAQEKEIPARLEVLLVILRKIAFEGE
ncbi:MAG: Hpt domain-containing protein [Fidelibacterota bacterium]|nr:MAG: Hpt domain-containing protein [Candidatus Neomarinimicrobiota bacterium]